MKYYTKPVEAFQIHISDNTETIEYFKRSIDDFDILHGERNSLDEERCAVMANGVSYLAAYGQWIVEQHDSFYGIEIVSDYDFKRRFRNMATDGFGKLFL